jgi:hypothetical protein
MAAYAITRERMLRGMGTTYSFVPRRRGLRGVGDDTTDVDVVTGLPCDDPRANCGATTPPFVFTDSKPNLPARKPITVGPGPNLTVATPGGVQIVFPSQSTVPPPPKFAPAAPSTSWFDQQLISGVPNSYLALGTVGAVLFMSMASAKRRR